jgi:RNA polymerase sigma factor (sigma-70 family)
MEHVLAKPFEQHREHLRAVAYRMLGSLSEAEDAVQEAWLRVSRTDVSQVDNLGGYLTTVVARVSLDALRARKSRRAREQEITQEPVVDPEREAVLADSVGIALLVVLETLGPAERLAFVLHEMFGLPFDEIAQIVGRSPAAVRQLASRARRRLHGTEAPEADHAAQRGAIDAFLSALRRGDMPALIAVLDPDVVVDGDRTPHGLATPLHGAEQAAAQVMSTARGARFARVAMIDGQLGVVVAPLGHLTRALRFTVRAGRITEIEVIAAPARLQALELALPNRDDG